MKKDVKDHDDRIDDNERRHNLNTVIIDGLKREYTIPIKEDVARQISKAVEVQFNAFDIADAFPYKSDNAEGIPSIQVCFKDVNLKHDIIKRKGMLKPTKYYVKEYLTKKQSSIFYQTRRAKKLGMLEGTWTIEGQVFFNTKPEVKGERINDLALITNATQNYERSKRNTTGQDMMETEGTNPIPQAQTKPSTESMGQPRSLGHERPTPPHQA